MLYVINFLFDPRIENGTFRKQQLETKVACCQDDNFRSYLDSSISYDCHALLINTCICMQSACLGATIVSLLFFNKFSLIPTLLRITSIAYFGCRNHFRQTNLQKIIRSLAPIYSFYEKHSREIPVEGSPKGSANHNHHGTFLICLQYLFDQRLLQK